MEPRVKVCLNTKPPIDSFYGYWKCAEEFAVKNYYNILQKYNNLKPEHMSVDNFFIEYIWCVYVSGFNSKVVYKKFSELIKVYNPWYKRYNNEEIWNGVEKIIANKRKFEAIMKTNRLLKDNSWLTFKKHYLSNIDCIRKLPYMGAITSYHLARNIGLDAIKPDLHLTRLSKHFKFKDPYDMCNKIAMETEWRLGVIDLILFYTASTFGTKNL